MHSLKRAYHLIKGFLSGLLGRQFFIFLFFLLLSGVFWLMMTLNETYEVEYVVPVRLTGVPKNVVMTTDMADSVRVTIRDKGYMMMGYEGYDKLHPVVISFNAYANRQTGRGHVPAQDIQKQIRQQLASSSVMTAFKADRLDFFFNYGRNRRIRVKVEGNIVPGGNYYLSRTQVSPDVVTVYASKDILDRITSVSTQRITATNFEDSLVRTVALEPIAGAKIVPRKVKVTFFADVLTEGSQKVAVKAINKPANLTIRTFPNEVTVRYNVGSSLFRLVSASDFEVVVDYREIASHPSDKCRLYLRNHSRFARNARLEVRQVDYLIEQQ